MIRPLKRKWKNEAETVIFYIFMPCAAISLVGGMLLGFNAEDPNWVWLGFLFFMLFFSLTFFLGKLL